jgi:hypothetical protein
MAACGSFCLGSTHLSTGCGRLPTTIRVQAARGGANGVNGVSQSTVPERGLAADAVAIASALVAAAIVALAVPRDTANGGPALLAILACAAVVAAPLFAPSARTRSRLTLYSGALPLLAMLAAIALAPRALPAEALLLTAGTAFAWCWALVALTARAPGAGLPIFAGVALLTTLPLWLDPWLARWGADSPATRIALAANPLVDLARAAGWDVLRSRWLYQHLALGSLRFRYPGVSDLILIDALLCLVPILLGRARRDRPHPPASTETCR